MASIHYRKGGQYIKHKRLKCLSTQYLKKKQNTLSLVDILNIMCINLKIKHLISKTFLGSRVKRNFVFGISEVSLFY